MSSGTRNGGNLPVYICIAILAICYWVVVL